MNSSLTFTLQIQWICASSFCHRLFCVATAMAKVSTACSITFVTHVEYTLPLSARGRLWLVRIGRAGSRACLYHICMVLQQPARNHRQQRACPLDSKTLRQTQAFLFQPLPLSLFNRPWYQAHLKSGEEPLMSVHFLCIQRKQPTHDKIALLPTPF